METLDGCVDSEYPGKDSVCNLYSLTSPSGTFIHRNSNTCIAIVLYCLGPDSLLTNLYNSYVHVNADHFKSC